jgi:hypothetical protein
MTKKEMVQYVAFHLLSKSISDDYVSELTDAIAEDVYQDVDETADPEEWNEDDVRLALGRVLLRKCGRFV